MAIEAPQETIEIAPATPVIGTFSNSYARLPEHFHARKAPAKVPEPRLIRFNRALADELGLEVSALPDETLAAIFSGNVVPQGAEPLAAAYAGHQFGNFVPQLGDGRAILLGEVVDRNGARRDIQLKGSGRTHFSRGGDGKAALGPVLREYLVSEAMHAMGVPTTRSLAAVLTGEPVFREDTLPGAVLTRVAASHVRVGTFQYFAVRGDHDGVKRLADYVIDRHYPDLREAGAPYLALLASIAERQALLIARWMQLGFIHGVMNTDNMAVSGETIDYGPCAFMDAYDPATVFSSIDQHGRYAFANQPRIAQWNLARLAETLLPLIDENEPQAIDKAMETLGAFPGLFEQRWLDGMRRKLGLMTEEADDLELLQSLLDAMHQNTADFTLTFRALCAAAEDPAGDSAVRDLFIDPTQYDNWAASWRERLSHEPMAPAERAAAMRAVNPAYIPRNHRVEQALNAASGSEDFAPFEELLSVITHPFEEREDWRKYQDPPRPEERVLRTFCGT